MPDEILTPRALNRSLLARQGLLARSQGSALDMVERLVGAQAQVPVTPYIALWLRLEGFKPEELSDLIAGRKAVRGGLMRATLHLVSARDFLSISPVTQPVLVKTFKSPWNKRLEKLARAEIDEVIAAGVELLSAEPRTRAQLSELLAPRWPDADPAALAHAVTFHAPIVQVPPRGLWRATGQATWAPGEQWLGAPLDANPSTDELMLRYLAAFGPATVADARTWSGLVGLREVFERLRPQLRTFRDERGRELFDVPEAPFPDPDTPAPPRFLPEYENVMLAHDDRTRVLAGKGPGLPFPRGSVLGTLLADGFYRANWKLEADDGTATLTIDRFTRLPDDPPGLAEEIVEEGERLIGFVVPESTERRVELGSAA